MQELCSLMIYSFLFIGYEGDGGISSPSQSLQELPKFIYRDITREQCRSLRSDATTPTSTTNVANCSVAYRSHNCAKGYVLFINCIAGAGDLISLTEKIKNMDTRRPVSFSMRDFQYLPQVLAPVRLYVTRVDIHNCLRSSTTSKLPTLNVPNLFNFGMFECKNQIIRRQDFSKNARLRIITFGLNVTFREIQADAFSDLFDLRHLALEYRFGRENVPFDKNQMTRLMQLHCSCEFAGIRRWINQNPLLISRKEANRVRIFGESAGNSDISQEISFVSIDCARETFEDAYLNKSTTYTVNDPCKLFLSFQRMLTRTGIVLITLIRRFPHQMHI